MDVAHRCQRKKCGSLTPTVSCLFACARKHVAMQALTPVTLAVFTGFRDFQAHTFSSAATSSFVTSTASVHCHAHPCVRVCGVCVCSFIEVRLAWGIAGIDRPDFVVWEPGVNRGNVVFYDGFNMTTRESQEFVLATCQLLRTRQCSLPGCSSGRQPNTITLPGGVKCWPEEFGSWVQVNVRQAVCASCVRPCHTSSCWLRIQPGWRLYQWATSTFDLCRSFAH